MLYSISLYYPLDIFNCILFYRRPENVWKCFTLLLFHTNWEAVSIVAHVYIAFPALLVIQILIVKGCHKFNEKKSTSTHFKMR